MNAYVLVIDSPYYAKAQASGAFAIHGVLPGRYELSAWHEAASTITRKPITVGAEGPATWPSPSAATSGRARSSPTNTDTSANRNSGTEAQEMLSAMTRTATRADPRAWRPPWRCSRMTAGRRRDAGCVSIARASPSGHRRGPGGRRCARADGAAGAAGRARGPGPERHREPAAGRRARRQGRRGDAARSAAQRAVVGAVPPRGRRLRPLQRRDGGGGDVAPARRASTRATWCSERAPAHRSVSSLVLARRAGVRGDGRAGRARRPHRLAGAGGDASCSTSGLLSGIAERAGAAAGISDGRRLLVAAPMDRRPAGPRATWPRSSRRLRSAAPGCRPATARATVAALPLSGGLRAGRRQLRPPPRAGGLPLPWPASAILVVGLALAVGVLPAARGGARRRRRRRARRRPPCASPADITVGRYALVDRIGQGGMAEIYAAVTTGEGSFRRPVVIKRLRPELTADPAAVAQFCDEANLLAAFHHPNIVAVHDFGPLAESATSWPRSTWPGATSGGSSSPPSRTTRRPLPAGDHRLRRAARCSRRSTTRTTCANERRAAAGDRPPRRLARERHGLRARRGEAARLRRRQGAEGRRHQDGDRRGQGKRHVHGPRAGARAATSTRAPISTRWRWCSTSAAPAGRSTPPTPPTACS